MERIEHHASFDGWQDVYQHESTTLGCTMKVGVYLPPQAQHGKVPVLYWLSGLTCTEQNFITKSAVQRYAAEHGIAVVEPDSSARGEGVADDPAFDLGQEAGFYVNATQEPWAANHRMYDYVVQELPALIEAHFPVTAEHQLPFHGRAWRPGHRPAQPGPLSKRLGLLAHRRPHPGSLGTQGLRGVPG